MASRKRNYDQMRSSPLELPTLLTRLRNTWQFACLMQYVQFFGSALKIDNELDIDMLEEECMKPYSQKLAQLGLTMLKWVSSHRGLTLDLFDEYTRRQYLARAPHLNPFGEEEEASKFSEFDIYTKLKVLHQLSVWTFHNPDRIRERMEESRDMDQAGWRIEPYGFDQQGRTYFLLDDNRLYRMADPTPATSSPKKPKPKARPKAKPKPKKTGSRSSMRRRLTSGMTSDHDDAEDVEQDEQLDQDTDKDNGLGGAKWQCIAVSIDEYREVIERFRKSRDADEKEMAVGLQEDVMPELEKADESKARKEAKRMKDLENLQRIASAKRSSRIAGRQEKERHEAEERAADMKRKQDLEMAHKERDRQMKAERDRESRMMTREQRIKDREMRRILHEEDLLKLKDRSQSVDSSEARVSERNRQKLLEKKQQDLEKLKQEELEDWNFDCSVCGVHGKNIDDGTHSIACDTCGVWEHSACHKITPKQAEQDNFKFVCDRCTRPKTGIKLKLSGQVSPSASMDVDSTYNAQFNSIKTVTKPFPTMNGSTPPMGTFRPPSSSNVKPSSSGSQSKTAPPYRPTSSYNASSPPQSGHKPSTTFPLSTPTLTRQHSATTGPNNVHSSSQPLFSTFSAVPPPHLPLTNGTSPSLSATQGNTDIHFARTTQPPLSPTRHATTSFATSPAPSQSYSPSSMRPAAGAVSPVKHSPHVTPSPAVSFGITGAGMGAGVGAASPEKSQAPLPGTPLKEKDLLMGKPTLSPSSTGSVGVGVPVKKATPGRSPSWNGPVSNGFVSAGTPTVNGFGHGDEEMKDA